MVDGTFKKMVQFGLNKRRCNILLLDCSVICYNLLCALF